MTFLDVLISILIIPIFFLFVILPSLKYMKGHDDDDRDDVGLYLKSLFRKDKD